MQYLFFCFRLTSLCKTGSRFIHLIRTTQIRHRCRERTCGYTGGRVGRIEKTALTHTRITCKQTAGEQLPNHTGRQPGLCDDWAGRTEVGREAQERVVCIIMLTCTAVQRKPTEHRTAIFLQLKNTFFKKGQE